VYFWSDPSVHFRQLLAVILSALLLASPSFSAQQVAAVAGLSNSTMVRGTVVVQGANIFNGDVVDVGQGGDSVLMLGHNSTVRVASDSAVRVFKCGDNSTVQLLRGQVILRTTAEQHVEVQIGDATVRPFNGPEVIGVVSFPTPTTGRIAAQKGSLTVTTAHDNTSRLVHEGEATEAKLSPAENATPNPPICGVAAAIPSQPSTTAWVMLGVGAAAIGAALALSGHSTTLTCPQKGALVSPYQFPCN
jgi:ferric-dicitrate binding protein FerR (iron transport regulator)